MWRQTFNQLQTTWINCKAWWWYKRIFLILRCKICTPIEFNTYGPNVFTASWNNEGWIHTYETPKGAVSTGEQSTNQSSSRLTVLTVIGLKYLRICWNGQKQRFSYDDDQECFCNRITPLLLKLSHVFFLPPCQLWDSHLLIHVHLCHSNPCYFCHLALSRSLTQRGEQSCYFLSETQGDDLPAECKAHLFFPPSLNAWKWIMRKRNVESYMGFCYWFHFYDHKYVKA